MALFQIRWVLLPGYFFKENSAKASVHVPGQPIPCAGESHRGRPAHVITEAADRDMVGVFFAALGRIGE